MFNPRLVPAGLVEGVMTSLGWFSDGAAERLDQTEEHVDELPDEPFIDCDR